MRFPFLQLFLLVGIFLLNSCATFRRQSTQGIVDLISRRLPNHVDNFAFSLTETHFNVSTDKNLNDIYTVSTLANGTVHVEGSSLSALAAGYVLYPDTAHPFLATSS
jgi:alpha-N-acetylglucosaminidase